MTIILTDLASNQEPVEVSAHGGTEGQLWLSSQDALAVSGWALKPQGLCKGDICMPVPVDQADNYVRENQVNLAAFWARMDKPLAHSKDGDVWTLGEGAGDRGANLASLEAPDFTLPDLDGTLHSLSDYRGQKVLLSTWASW